LVNWIGFNGLVLSIISPIKIKGSDLKLQLKLKDLRETLDFYNKELKGKGLTEKQRDKFLLAKASLEKIVEEKGEKGEK